MDYRKMYNKYYGANPQQKDSSSVGSKISAFFKKNKQIFKIAGIVLVSLVALRYGILIFTPKPEVPVEFKNQLDDLNKTTAQYQVDQKRYDSLLAEQGKLYAELDQKISMIKEKVTIVREYYHIKSTAIDKYTPTQVDSFLKSRYKY